MRVSSTAPLLTLFLLLGACRSDPVHYHTLTPLFLTKRVAQPASDFQIDVVKVPPQVDRSQVVVRQAGNELIVLETDWWGATLVDEVESALNTELDMKSGSGKKSTLRIELQRFDLIPGQKALIDAKWRIRDAQIGTENVRELSCRSILQTPSGVTVDDLVVAQTHNLQQLASIISDASRTSTGRCP